VIGEGLPLGEPGSVKGVQLVVEDIEAVREALAGRGVAVGDVQQLGPQGSPGSRFCFFEDPDGNAWAAPGFAPGSTVGRTGAPRRTTSSRSATT
jgi:catechol 2,3-dioxygenase-like lactoylglutathione lyase family enzyme